MEDMMIYKLSTRINTIIIGRQSLSGTDVAQGYRTQIEEVMWHFDGLSDTSSLPIHSLGLICKDKEENKSKFEAEKI